MIEANDNQCIHEGAAASSNPLPKVIVFIALVGCALVGWKYLGGAKHALAEAGWIYDWDQAVEQASRTGKPALVLFTADWCGPCRMFKSQVLSDREVQSYLREHYTLVVVDVTERSGPNARRAAEFNVRGIPALILYNESGQEVARGGGMPADALLAWLGSNGRAMRSR